MKCSLCENLLARWNKSGFCRTCFNSNVENCKTNYMKAYNQTSQGKRSLWKNRGAIITEEEFTEWVSKTNCEICGDIFGQKVMDHCHETGQYRGALCKQCNAALGKLGDDLDLVIKRLSCYKQGRVKL
jgi:predicted amidophosphoribosyltransferase